MHNCSINQSINQSKALLPSWRFKPSPCHPRGPATLAAITETCATHCTTKLPTTWLCVLLCNNTHFTGKTSTPLSAPLEIPNLFCSRRLQRGCLGPSPLLPSFPCTLLEQPLGPGGGTTPEGEGASAVVSLRGQWQKEGGTAA